jgi:uncharacterized membrane protein/DNA-binding MarR family transcriptional regulator
LKGEGRLGWWATIVVVFLLIAPLATLASGADGGPSSGEGRFTYSSGDDVLPTLFIGPDRVPVATWEDDQGRLRLSRLSPYEPAKTGLVLTNLPRTAPEPVYGFVDVVAMDANGVLHVVWDDGSGGVWHKGYDTFGNVIIGNQRLSALEATASAPAMVATPDKEGTVAWVTWIETREGIGTHVRLVSLDPSGHILDSALVDDWTRTMDPLVSDVGVDLDGNPHITFLADDGAHWAVRQDDGTYVLHKVHDDASGSLPTIIVVPEGDVWAMWTEYRATMARTLLEDGLGDPELIISVSLKFRVADIHTIINGGPLGIITDDPGWDWLYADGEGGIVAEITSKLGITIGYQDFTFATDDRGQTYMAVSAPGSGSPDYRRDCSWSISDRMSDVTLSPSSPADPVLLRPGTSIDVPVVVESLVGYPTLTLMAVERTTGSSTISVDLATDEALDLDGGAKAIAYLTVTASPSATHGSMADVSIIAHPSGWPEATTSMSLRVEVPEYRPFIIRGLEGPIAALPDEGVTATVAIESWSDQDETVSLEIRAPRGWTVDVPDEIEVRSGDTLEVPLEITAPPATPIDTMVNIDVAGSTTDGTEGAGTIISAVVVPHAKLRLDMGSGVMEVMPATPASHEARVRNTGNEDLTLQFYAHPNLGGWSAHVEPATMSLTPGSEAPLLVWVEAPDGAAYLSQSRIMIVAAREGGHELEVAYLRATVGHKVAYDALLMPTSAPLMDGRSDLTLELVNLGNAPEDVTMEFLGLPDGWTVKAAVGHDTIRLSAGEVRSFSVAISAPQDTAPGTVPIAVQVRGSSGPIVRWVDIHVAEVFDADLILETDARTVTPPATITVPFTIISVGNSPGYAHLSVEGVPFGWDYSIQDPNGAAAISYPVDLGGIAKAQLALRIPDWAEGDAHAIDIVVRSGTGELLSRTPLYVRLRFPDLTVLDVRVFPDEPREGTPLTIRARVLNLGMADAADVSVVLKDGNTILDRDILSLVPRLGELEVVLYMVPDHGLRTLSLEVDPADEIREISEANNMAKRRIRVRAAPEEPLVSPGVAQASVVAIITLSALGALGGTEAGRYALFSLLLIPLYTKIKKDKVLDHYLRGKIHGYIIANPGEHYNAIKEQLEVTNGALSYHLRVLEREGYVRSRMDGIYKRFYPSDMKLPTNQRNISSFQEVILTIVKNNQGLSQKDIAKRIGASSQVINYHIKTMEEAGLIEVDRSRRKSRVFATDAPPAVPSFD